MELASLLKVTFGLVLLVSQSLMQQALHRATRIKEHAVETPKAKVPQEKSAHQLSHKGIFTQETRNLVCFLSKSACSANRINEIITCTQSSRYYCG